MPLTEEQRRALPGLRAQFTSAVVPFGSSKSLDERASLQTTDIPDDITVRVEIAPPLSTPLPLIDGSALKAPERVPVFYYNLRGEHPTPTAPEDAKVIFYIHGGGNLQAHPTDVRYVNLLAPILRAVASNAGGSAPACTIIAPCYRLVTVPENAFPAGVQDILAAYDHVISQGYKASNITVAGDSAGGNHALVLTHLALQSDRPVPSGVIVISPASLQVYTNLSEHAKAQADVDLLTLAMYEFSAKTYVEGTLFTTSDPLVSASLLTFTEAWPRTLILVGTADQLIDASRELERRLKAVKRPVELVEYDERPHGWWLVDSVFPEEIQDCARRFARFVLG